MAQRAPQRLRDPVMPPDTRPVGAPHVCPQAGFRTRLPKPRSGCFTSTGVGLTGS